VNPLDRMLRTYVAPVLRELGFSKRGRRYRFTAPRGDRAEIEVEAFSPLGGRVRFAVSYGVAPSPLTGWLLRIEDPDELPDRSYDMWHDTLLEPGREHDVMNPPRDAMGHLVPREEWYFTADDPADEAARGATVAGLLQDLVVPVLMRMLDRATLLATIQDPATPPGQLGASDRLAPLMLLADAGPSQELDAGLRPIEAEGDPLGFVAWARGWAAHRAAADTSSS
jgi:hypothetical protein